jgi:hypothetical protein
VIRRRLGQALDWRFGGVVARIDALSIRLEQIEERIEAMTLMIEDRVQPVLRSIVDEESQNRRRLYALRASVGYEAAYTELDPLVSITVATRDRPRLLVDRALPSLLAQTHTHLEVLVIGDAASPETAEAVAGLADTRVRYVNLSQRITAHADPARHQMVGSTMARNEAARLAQGRWLLHFDDDDHLRPDAIASLLELARERRAEVAYGGFESHRLDGQITTALAFPPQPGLFGWQGALLHGGLRFFERELIAAHLGLAGDIYLLDRMLRVGVRFAMLDRVVWDYSPSGLSTRPSVLPTTSQISSAIAGSSPE